MRRAYPAKTMLARAAATQASALTSSTLPATGLAHHPRLWLKNPEYAQQWPQDGLSLHRLPFVIGRMPSADDTARSHVDLRLPDAAPFQLSQVHFCILKYADRLAVMDTDSQLGTSVNGVGIGRGRNRNHAFLAQGINRLTVGTSKTRFVFELLVK